MQKDAQYSIVIAGASGDLARRKILPALFSLYAQGLLSNNLRVFGYARSAMSDEEFRARAAEHLACRYTPGERCEDLQQSFLARCAYVRGDYERPDDYAQLARRLAEEEGASGARRLFYLAVPPSVFGGTVRALAAAGLDRSGPDATWPRVAVEKPFGRDRASSDQLAAELAGAFTEDRIYRMDHYLGKEVIQNLLVLRFANAVFEPLWNGRAIRSVSIRFKEPFGIRDRGGYFDSYGIVRDVMQNHLLQMLALVAMEPPDALTSDQVRAEKVRVLRAIPPLSRDDVVFGQYVRPEGAGDERRGYREEKGVAPDSRTPTCATAVLQIRNSRWEGVPFLMQAGKALDEQLAEIRLRFRSVPRNLFYPNQTCPPPNELILHVQPDSSIRLCITTKVPRLEMKLAETELNLRYAATFQSVMPEAYETLLLDVLRGDKNLLVGPDELAAAWDIFDPMLRAAETEGWIPEPYAFGSAGPAKALALAERYGCHGGTA